MLVAVFFFYYLTIMFAYTYIHTYIGALNKGLSLHKCVVIICNLCNIKIVITYLYVHNYEC